MGEKEVLLDGEIIIKVGREVREGGKKWWLIEMK